GLAVREGSPAYTLPVVRLRRAIPPSNRPGVPPEIITWADPAYLADFRQDIAALRPRVDVLVASCHWGLGKDVLAYMTEIAHAAIDAGADIVVGHGPHYCLPAEVYKAQRICYGLSTLSFHTGHGGRAHGDWIGALVRIAAGHAGIEGVTLQFVRHNDRNETLFCPIDKEAEALAEIKASSAAYGTKLTVNRAQVHVDLKG